MNAVITHIAYVPKINLNLIIKPFFHFLQQRSRGFGFITFSTPEAVERVLSVSSHSLDGKKIDPKHATPKSKSKANKVRRSYRDHFTSQLYLLMLYHSKEIHFQ